jgi:hypothetical protein
VFFFEHSPKTAILSVHQSDPMTGKDCFFSFSVPFVMPKNHPTFDHLLNLLISM